MTDGSKQYWRTQVPGTSSFDKQQRKKAQADLERRRREQNGARFTTWHGVAKDAIDAINANTAPFAARVMPVAGHQMHSPQMTQLVRKNPLLGLRNTKPYHYLPAKPPVQAPASAMTQTPNAPLPGKPENQNNDNEANQSQS